MHRILIITKDPGVRAALVFPESAACEATFVQDSAEALSFLASGDCSLILIDTAATLQNSLVMLREARSSGYSMPAVFIADTPSRDFTVAALQTGAFDVLDKPLDQEMARVIIRRALDTYALEQEVLEFRHKAFSQELAQEIISQSPAMSHALDLARKVSRTDVTVLITGESGSGKELFAKAIHGMSERRDGPFVSINCAAIPETLLEAELFGYEKGAFTGATRQHTGKFERASGGTIFLDEIGELPPGLQVKLLRVLQEREIERLGGSHPIRIDIRLISATNKDLDLEVGKKRFREDLLYRVRVFEIRVPALRERKEDIPLLADRFVKKYAREMGRDVRGVDKLSLKFFLTYAWPGNVRELENLIQRAIILEDRRSILRGDSLLGLLSGNQSIPATEQRSAKERLLQAREQEEKKLIMEALIQSHWRRQQAADILGVSRKTLFNKIKKYGI